MYYIKLKKPFWPLSCLITTTEKNSTVTSDRFDFPFPVHITENICLGVWTKWPPERIFWNFVTYGQGMAMARVLRAKSGHHMQPHLKILVAFGMLNKMAQISVSLPSFQCYGGHHWAITHLI